MTATTERKILSDKRSVRDVRLRRACDISEFIFWGTLWNVKYVMSSVLFIKRIEVDKLQHQFDPLKFLPLDELT